MSHDSRPGTVFYSLNRRARVVRRFGMYTVQRRNPKVPSDLPRWRQHGKPIPDMQQAIVHCGSLEWPYEFVAGVGWL
jgi:hypothetical protein